MGFLTFLKRKDKAEMARQPRSVAADAVQQARTRARQRLIGAVLLLGVGLVGFPLLFETQPRPLAIDIPIEIPHKDATKPLAVPAPRAERAEAPAALASAASGLAVGGSGVDATAPVLGSTPTSLTSQSQEGFASDDARPQGAPASAASAVVSDALPKAAGAAQDDGSRAKALLETAAKEQSPAAADKGRFVVQVGAFADAQAARDVRQKLERIGLKTYTQVIESDAGRRTRVRVGPFVSRGEAEKAAGRIKSIGLASAILTL